MFSKPWLIYHTQLDYEVCDCYLKDGGQAYCVSHLSEVPSRKCPLHGLQLTLSFYFLLFFFVVFIAHRFSHLYPAFSAVEISGGKKEIFGVKTTLTCVDGGVKKLGLLSSESWWIQGQGRFQAWSFWDMTTFTPPLPTLSRLKYFCS